MRASRRLEVDVKQKKHHQEDHLSTFHIPYEKAVESIPYYNKRKRELKSKNFMYNSKIESDSHQNEPKSEEKVAENPFDQDFPLAQLITNITVEPVFNDNKFTNFNPEHYPLNENEKVKVVEEKFFPLQNYYNYIYAMKSQEEIFKLAEVTQQKANEIIKKQKRNKGTNYVESLEQEQSQPLIKEHRKVKG